MIPHTFGTTIKIAPLTPDLAGNPTWINRNQLSPKRLFTQLLKMVNAWFQKKMHVSNPWKFQLGFILWFKWFGLKEPLHDPQENSCQFILWGLWIFSELHNDKLLTKENNIITAYHTM